MRDFSMRLRVPLLVSALISQGILWSVHLPYNRFDWSNLQHMPLAKWVLDHHPSWYNPDPQIFIARTQRVFDFTKNSSPVLYFNTNNKLVKLAVHVKNIDSLSIFGYKPNDLSVYPKVRSGSETWIYINDIEERTTKSSLELLRIIQKSEEERIIREMRANPSWMEELTRKAARNHIGLEEQLNRDATYLFMEAHGLNEQQ
jgi:hypothetical protein